MLEQVHPYEPPSPVLPEEPQLSPVEKVRFQLDLAQRMSGALTDEAMMGWADRYAAQCHELTANDAALRARIRQDPNGAIDEIARRLDGDHGETRA